MIFHQPSTPLYRHLLAPWHSTSNITASYRAEQSVNQPTAAKMADWKVTVPINLPLDTIMAIHNDESIEAALSDFADSGLKGHAVVHDVVRAIIDTVNGSAYRITCDSKSKMPPATYSHPTSRTAKEHEAYDSLSTPKGSFRSQQTLGQDDSVKKGGWSSPLHIHIVIRSTVNKDEHFYVTPDITIASLSNSYVARTTVSGKCYRLKHEVWGMTTEFLDMNATIKQVRISVFPRTEEMWS